MVSSVVFNLPCEPSMELMPDKYFDIAIVDPPYGIKEGAHRANSRNKLTKTTKYKKQFWDDDIPSQEYFDQLFRISKHQIIFGINYFLSRRDIPFSAGRIVWDKCNGESNFSDAEIAYCSMHHSTRLFRFMWNGMNQGISFKEGHIMQGNKALNEKRIHPTQKPVELYKWLYLQYVKMGWKVLDTHVGSGSNRIVADMLGNDFTGYEKDRNFFDDQEERFSIYKAQLKLFNNGV